MLLLNYSTSMAIKFKINKLGPIRESEFELNSFVLFSGESGLGKSYSTYLIHYFATILRDKRLNDFFNEKHDLMRIKNALLRDGFFVFEFDVVEFKNWISKNAKNYLSYLLNHPDIECDVLIDFDSPEKISIEILKNKDQDTQLDYKNYYTFKSEKKVTIVLEDLLQNDDALIIHLLMDLVVLNLNIFPRKHPIFFPTSRGALVGINNTEAALLRGVSGLYREFLDDFNFISNTRKEPIEQNKTLLELLNDVFSGKIQIDKSKIIYNYKNLRIPLTAAASSIKELSPLFLLLNQFESKDLSILFEEPEAHLHPSLQRKVALLLSYLVNNGAYLQVSTHSDYFTNQINNIIKCSIIKNNAADKYKTHKEEFEKLGLSESVIFDYTLLSAYYFERHDDGSVRIVKQNILEEGVPFDTFENTVNKMVNETNEINDIFFS